MDLILLKLIFFERQGQTDIEHFFLLSEHLPPKAHGIRGREGLKLGELPLSLLHGWWGTHAESLPDVRSVHASCKLDSEVELEHERAYSAMGNGHPKYYLELHTEHY